MIAATDINHDGKLIPVGTKVTKSTFGDKVDDKVIENLKAAGALVDHAEGLSPEDKEAKIAALRAELADLGATEEGSGVVPPTPGNAAEQLAKDEAIARLVAEGKSRDEAVKQVEADIKKAEDKAKAQSK